MLTNLFFSVPVTISIDDDIINYIIEICKCSIIYALYEIKLHCIKALQDYSMALFLV